MQRLLKQSDGRMRQGARVYPGKYCDRIDTSRTTVSHTSALHPQCTGTGGRVVSGRAGMGEEAGVGVKVA